MYPIRSLRRWKRAGLLSELRGSEAERLLPRRASADAPSPSLLRAYYDAGGDSVEAAWRRQQDRYVEVPTTACPEAVADAIENAFPVVGTVRVRRTAHALEVYAGDDVATVARVVRHRRLEQRQLRRPVDRPRDVIRAVNAILARRGQRRRFVELHVGPSRHAFVAVDHEQARALLEWGATVHRDSGTLAGFAGWELQARALATG